MLNWVLSGICITLLVLIIYNLLTTMRAFNTLHNELIVLDMTDPADQASMMESLSSPPDAPIPNADHMSLMHPIALIPDDTDEPNCQEASLYLASVHGTRFHKQDCSSVKRIRSDNLRYFKDRNEAVASGYDPCGICNP